MLQRLWVGVLAGLHEVVQVEVACDERGLASGWSRGSGSFRYCAALRVQRPCEDDPAGDPSSRPFAQREVGGCQTKSR